MIWVPERMATRGEIDHALKEVYPTTVLDELEVATLDHHLPSGRFEDLLTRVASVPQSAIAVEVELGKAHVLHINQEGTADWEKLNREFTPQERVRAVKENGAGILYWNVLLSRVAPFWTGYWNLFEVENGTVFPKVVAEDVRGGWVEVSNAVRSVLGSYGLKEVSPKMLDSPVAWLRATQSEELGAAGTRQPLTVYDAVFSDM